jgi:hypothetical protein
MTPRRTSWLFTFVCALGASSVVSAHAPAKVLQYLSTKPDDLVVATNRGLIFGNLATRDFKLLCNEAYAVAPSEETVRYARLASGRLLVASSDGLQLSDDNGCTWRFAPALADQLVPGLAQHPTDPLTLYVTTYAREAPRSGALRISRDGGETFETLLTVPDEFLRTLHVVPSSPLHIYFAGWVLGAMRSYYVGRSADGGLTWERFTIALEPEENDLLLLAVNPKQPNELLARAVAPEPVLGERLLWSRDGGRTFIALGKLPGLMHASFSSDGSVAYVGSLNGLQRVSGAAEARQLEPMANGARISQVAEQDGTILGGGYYRGLDQNADGIGVAKPPNLTFDRWFDFSEVDAPASCSGAADKVCRLLWEDWLRENVLTGAADDAGADAGAPASDASVRSDAAAGALDASDGASRPAEQDAGPTEEADGSKGKDGCSLLSQPPAVGALLPWLALFGCLLRRRRRS